MQEQRCFDVLSSQLELLPVLPVHRVETPRQASRASYQKSWIAPTAMELDFINTSPVCQARPTGRGSWFPDLCLNCFLVCVLEGRGKPTRLVAFLGKIPT